MSFNGRRFGVASLATELLKCHEYMQKVVSLNVVSEKTLPKVGNIILGIYIIDFYV